MQSRQNRRPKKSTPCRQDYFFVYKKSAAIIPTAQNPMSLIPKKEYNKLSPSAKAALSAVAKVVKGRGAYMTAPAPRRAVVKPLRRAVKGSGAYEEKEESGRSIAKRAASSFVGYIWDKLIGNGAYAPMTVSVKHNSFMEKITANGPPSVWTTKENAFVMRHREYLKDIITDDEPDTFKIEDFAIQPGNAQTFPWLSKIARQFQQYRIRGMLFEFVSTSSDALNSTNTALGQVMLVTQYDSGASTFETKQQILQTEFASVSKPSLSVLHPVECKPSLTTLETLYVRTGAVPEGQDIRFYDLGRFSIATNGFQGSAVNIGELWVTYEIELIKPIQLPGVDDVAADFYTGTTGISTTNPFGTNAALAQGSNAGTTISGKRVTLTNATPGDQWLLVYQQAGTAASLSAPTLASVGAEMKAFWQNYAVIGAAAPSNTVSTSSLAMWALIVKTHPSITSAPYVECTYGGVLTSPTSAAVSICKIPGTLSPQAALAYAQTKHPTEFGSCKIQEVDDACGLGVAKK